MKVVTKLGIGFGTILLLLIAILSFGLYSMVQIQSRLDDVVHVNAQESKLAVGLRDAVTDRMSALRNMAMVTTATDVAAEAARVAEQDKAYADALDALSKRFAANPDTSAEEHALLARVKEIGATATPLINKAQSLATSQQHDAATAVLVDELRPLQRSWVKTLSDLVALQESQSDQAATEADAAFAFAWKAMVALGVVSLIAGLAASVTITRGLTRQLGGEPGDAMIVAGEIAAGNLRYRVPVSAQDERSLMASLEKMRAQLNGIVLEIQSSGEAISTAAGEIAQGTADLSQRTEEQAASLEETAASMEELASTVRQNAENAAQGNALAENASKEASQGGDVVGQVIATMHDISDSSTRMADIISVIEGIAFQTNILALNAAVEAARAGEEGRGFAVVAGEVRALAQRSASAAKEIKELIEGSVDRVKNGSALVARAGDTMTGVMHAVRRVTDIMSEVSAASGEQRTGIDQVNLAVTQMDEVTQQNAALVEQASAAAQSMAEQAQSLRRAVAIFQVDGRTAGSASALALALVSAASPMTGVTHTQPGMPTVSANRTNVPKPTRKPPARKAPVAAPAAITAAVVPAAAGDWQTF